MRGRCVPGMCLRGMEMRKARGEEYPHVCECLGIWRPLGRHAVKNKNP